ncbi:hypothetical protein GCM10025870_31860 [Agromyces marinus]|uniref:Thiamine-monophosphate kinase n=2 Tax=Agromyces marinus TaxID=1389020 RepID=A0ABN6YFX0_9MICO|nr:hypothetical protein GCM10025870_31860 [Agromyces marinus]
MLDVSDGLARDARRLAEASGVALDFHGSAFGDDPMTALAGAEDHGLLATFPAGAVPPEPFQVVGSVVAGGGGAAVRAGLLTLDGEPVDTGGWDPYSGWDGIAG